MRKACTWLQGALAFALAAALSIPVPAIAFAEEAASNAAGINPAVQFDSEVSDSTGDTPASEDGAGIVDANNQPLSSDSANSISSSKDSVNEANDNENESVDKEFKKVTAADALQMIAVGQPEVVVGNEQQVPVFMLDKSKDVKDAVLTIRNAETLEKKVVKASEYAQYAANFLFDTTEWTLGSWFLVTLECVVGEDAIQVDLSDIDGMMFDVVSEESEADATEAETSFYTVENGEVSEVSSIQEAISVAKKDADETAQTTTGPIAAKTRAVTRAGEVVVGLDAGHGGTDPGASANGDNEAAITGKIMQYCAEELQTYSGVRIVYSPRVSSRETRVNSLADQGAQIIVSFHINAGGGNGAEVYAPNYNYNASIGAEGHALAQAIQNELVALGLTNRGVKEWTCKDDAYPDGSKMDYLGINQYAKLRGIPGVLIEHAFIDSSDYANFLNSDDKLRRLGVADATGIANYLGLQNAWEWNAKVTASTPADGKVRITVDGSNAPAGIAYVNVPVWGDLDGQNDIIWYSASKSGNNWIVDVPLSNHAELSTYSVHVYAGMSRGAQQCVGSTSFSLIGKEPTSTLSASPNVDAGTITYTATLKAPLGAGSVRLPVWCETVGGQDDICWYDMSLVSKSADTYTYTLTISMANHKYQVGNYVAHLYAYDACGIFSGWSVGNTEMKLPDMKLSYTASSPAHTYTVMASGGLLPSATSVSFPVWSDEGGQDDIIWYQAAKTANGNWVASVPISNHMSAGSYSVHCYAVFGGNQVGVGGISFVVEAPTSTLSASPNVDAGTITYTATLKAPLGAGSVRLPVWCETVGGQDDICWYDMSLVSKSADTYTYTLTISMANHKYQVGNYVAHLYAYDACGIFSGWSVGNTEMKLPDMKLSYTASSPAHTYTVMASGGLLPSATSVSFPVWSDEGGQDDIIWYQAAKTANGNWVASVPISNHMSAGSYSVHCYAVFGGNQVGVGGISFVVEAPTSTLSASPNVDAGTITYTATLKAPLGAGSVRLPVWCETVGGQDDICWYDMSLVSKSADTYTYTLTISMANHKYQVGNYVAHLYAYDACGIFSGWSVGNTEMKLPDMKLSYTASSPAHTYTVMASGGLLPSATSVSFPVWSDEGGQDDIIWYQAAKTANGNWVASVPISNHMSAGSYSVHCYAVFGGNQVGVGGISFVVDKAIIDELGYPIMGTTTVTAQQMVRMFNAQGKTYPSSVYSSKGAPTIESFCATLVEQAAKEGVRAEVLFAQAMHETGWLQFGGDVKAEQCNFGGLGATGGGVQGCSFANVQTGLLAQAQHLKAYATDAPLNTYKVDPRYDYVSKGCAPTVMQLGGKWAADVNYGTRLITLINSLKVY